MMKIEIGEVVEVGNKKKPHYLLIAVCGNRNSKHIALSTYVNVSQCNGNMPTLIKIEVIFFFPACFIIGK